MINPLSISQEISITGNGDAGHDIPDSEFNRIASQHLVRECRTGAEMAGELGNNLFMLRRELARFTNSEFLDYAQRQFQLSAPVIWALIESAESAQGPDRQFILIP